MTDKTGALTSNPSAVVERLLDAAFRELQHDTGPANPEWVHQRRVLTREFTKILHTPSSDETTSKPARDADHCDFPDCEQHNLFVVALLTDLENHLRHCMDCSVSDRLRLQSAISCRTIRGD